MDSKLIVTRTTAHPAVQCAYGVADGSYPVSALVEHLERAEAQLPISVWDEALWPHEFGDNVDDQILRDLGSLAPDLPTPGEAEFEALVCAYLDETGLILLASDFCNSHTIMVPGPAVRPLTWRHWACIVDRWAVSRHGRAEHEYGYTAFYMARREPRPIVEDYDAYRDAWLSAIHEKTRRTLNALAPQA